MKVAGSPHPIRRRIDEKLKTKKRQIFLLRMSGGRKATPIALEHSRPGELSENEMTKAGLKLKKLDRLVLGWLAGW